MYFLNDLLVYLHDTWNCSASQIIQVLNSQTVKKPENLKKSHALALLTKAGEALQSCFKFERCLQVKPKEASHFLI